MEKIIFAFTTAIFLMTSLNLGSQTIFPLVDPNGDQIKIYRSDSLWFEEVTDNWNIQHHLAVYKLDRLSGYMNIMVTNGSEGSDHTYWLFDQGFETDDEFSGFFHLLHVGIYFRIGAIWYVSDFTKQGTFVFYDGSQTADPYEIFMLFGFETSDGLRITAEAINLNSGEEHLLWRHPINHQLQIVETLEGRIQVKKFLNERSNYEDIVARVWDEDNNTWSNYGVYEVRSLTFILERFSLPTNNFTNILYQSCPQGLGEYLFYNSDTLSVLKFDESLEKLIDYTDTFAEGDELLGIDFMRSAIFGTDQGSRYYIRRLDSKGNLQFYFVQDDDDSLDLELLPALENAIIDDIFILQNLVHQLFFYNHDDVNSGYSTLNLNSGEYISDPINSPLQREFQIYARGQYVYYAYFDQADDTFYAALDDVVGHERVNVIKGQNDSKIENPRRFQYLDIHGEVVIQSAVGDSIEFYVYDPDGKVSTVDHISYDITMDIFPNPASNVLNVQLAGKSQLIGNHYNYTIFDPLGRSISHGREEMLNGKSEIRIDHLDLGLYFIQCEMEDSITRAFRFVKQ